MSATPSSGAATAAPPAGTQQKPFQTKLVLLGEAAVGKSSVVLRFVSNEFQENKEPTIGAAFLTQKCRLDSAVIKFEIWDTAGQERFHSLAPMYYRNAQASAVIYDITKASSFEKAKSWVKELQRQANPNIVIALVGNKLDLISDAKSTIKANSDTSGDEEEDDDEEETDTVTGEQQTGASSSSSGNNTSARAVPKEEAKAYADESNLLFFETSAKTGEGVVELFTEIAKKIPIDQIVASQQRSAAANNPAGNNRTGPNAGRTSASGSGVDLNANAGQNNDACNC